MLGGDNLPPPTLVEIGLIDLAKDNFVICFGNLLTFNQNKSPPWTILWFRILGIFSVENIILETIVSY